MKNVRDTAVFEVDSDTVRPHYALHPYQRQVLADILKAFSSPERRVVAHLPTGAGKTRIATHVACHLLNGNETAEALVIWLASAEELCQQAADELARAWGFLGLRDAAIHRYWGKQSVDLLQLSSGFLVTGLAKLRSKAMQDVTLLPHLAHRACAVIFDEAHQAIAETFSFLSEQLCSVRPPLLGLTATPGRTTDFTEADYQLAKMFNNRKVSIDPRGYSNSVTYLIQNRFLAKPNFVRVSFDSETHVPEPISGFDYGGDDLDKLGSNHARNRKIVELAELAGARHPRTIVFCPSVESALECNRLFHCSCVKTHVITANTPTNHRHAIIKLFRDRTRNHMVIFNYGVLTAGFDAPRTRCAIIARPTTSLVLYSQMVGRAMRGPRAGGNPRSEIYTVADTNLPGFGSVTEAFTNWEELWTTD